MSSLRRSIAGLVAAMALGTGHTSPLSVIGASSVASTDLHTRTTLNAELSDPNAAGEPGTLVLLGLGLVALALIRRLRSRK